MATGTPTRAVAEPRPASIGAQKDPIASMRMRRGQAPIAGYRLRKEVAEQPDDLDLQAMLGEACARSGAYADALAAFESGRVADGYERSAMEAHADVLRVLGEPGEAAALRTQLLWEGPASTIQDLEVFLDLVDDRRSDGDLDRAWDAATMALAVGADRGAPYAQLAEVLMDLGRWDEARGEIAVGDLLGPRTSYLLRAAVRMLVHDGRFAEAATIVTEAAKGEINDAAIYALKADVTIAAGDAEAGLGIARARRFDSVDHPQMLLAKLHGLERSGSVAEADAVARQFRSLYARPVLSSLGVREYPSVAPAP
jgi:tetratricopeptide (TPR) repeat protein